VTPALSGFDGVLFLRTTHTRAQLDMFTELLVSQPFVSVSEPFHPNQRSYYGGSWGGPKPRRHGVTRTHSEFAGRLNENFKQFVQGAKGDTLEAYRMHSDGVGGDKDCVMQVRRVCVGVGVCGWVGGWVYAVLVYHAVLVAGVCVPVHAPASHLTQPHLPSPPSCFADCGRRIA
jgi:hypothetical protein